MSYPPLFVFSVLKETIVYSASSTTYLIREGRLETVTNIKKEPRMIYVGRWVDSKNEKTCSYSERICVLKHGEPIKFTL